MRLTLAPDVVLTVVDTGAVLLDGRRGRYWQLNGPACEVLRRVLDGELPADVAASLPGAGTVGEAQARRDVTTLIDALTASRLVEVSP